MPKAKLRLKRKTKFRFQIIKKNKKFNSERVLPSNIQSLLGSCCGIVDWTIRRRKPIM